MLAYLDRKERGFTLMELLIAVAIVAVLAGVGIPVYMGLQGRAKASEATANLDGIGLCQESYKLTNDTYIDCYASPVDPDAVTQTQTTWNGIIDPAAGGVIGFDLIGFDTNKPVRFSYAVGGATHLIFYAGALGDTNGDGARTAGLLTGPTGCVLYVSSNSEGPHVVSAADAAAVDAAGAGALQTATAFNDSTVVLPTATSD